VEPREEEEEEEEEEVSKEIGWEVVDWIRLT
jgi:hypothetical protein